MMNTEITTATYRFSRDENSLGAILTSQRPSTDAMNVIEKWKGAGSGRSDLVVKDETDFLVATLTFLSGDRDKAASDIDGLCKQFGVKRDFVPS